MGVNLSVNSYGWNSVSSIVIPYDYSEYTAGMQYYDQQRPEELSLYNRYSAYLGTGLTSTTGIINGYVSGYSREFQLSGLNINIGQLNQAILANDVEPAFYYYEGNITETRLEFAQGIFSGNDVITGPQTGSATWQKNTFFGFDGADTINAGTGSDDVWGGAGADWLIGGSGSDELYGESGHDNLAGSLGDDTLSGGDGNDILASGQGNDSLLGGLGNDIIQAGIANDTVFAGSGDDVLRGGGGNDRMYGGAGTDVIYGGGGDDSLEGGMGTDYFVYESGSGNDRIFGFDLNNDKIVISPNINSSSVLTASEIISQATVDPENSDNTIIALGVGDNDITLVGVTLSQLNQGMFVIGNM